jgi:thiamine-monophosphate kinase
MSDGERELVRWLMRRSPHRPEVLVGIGDDMAALDLGGGPVLVTCDMLLDGVHFDTAAQALGAIGRKAANCSLSDCAAMAVRPVGAVVSVALPRGFGLAKTQELLEALSKACAAFDCPLIGGDTTSWPQPLAIDVTMLATPYPGIAPVRRNGARPGDRIFTTGPLGGSLLGKHLDFTPRIAEARRLAETLGGRLHAMLDVTDGLALDLDRMCEASGVGAILDESMVLAAASEAAHAAAGQSGRSVLEHVFADGEDFELLFATAADNHELQTLGSFPLGEIVAGSGMKLRRPDGGLDPLEPRGYQHL